MGAILLTRTAVCLGVRFRALDSGRLRRSLGGAKREQPARQCSGFSLPAVVGSLSNQFSVEVNRPLIFLLAGLGLCAVAFSGSYYFGTASARKLMSQPEPELAWLKKEFHLGDAEFNRISQMHQAYLPKCQQRCLRIADQNRKLEELLQSTDNLSPQIRDLLAERATTRAECEAEMLAHFLAVSRTMPPEQGRRYLAWIESQTSLFGGAMEKQHQMTEGHHH